MKAFILERYGKNAPLLLGEVAEPVVGDNDVLVRVQATAINQLDSRIRDGAFKPILPYKPPLVLGHDVAGTVIAVGSKVSRFKPGDEVYARPRDGRIGTFAERIAIDEADLALKPANLSMAEAASIPLVGLTAWQALVQIGKVKKGQKVFIQAGSGGVGTIAIQLAKHLGAYVATTTSAANAEMVKGLGADLVIDYRTEDFAERLSGYDLVLNSQDPETLRKSLTILKPDGIAISISGPPDPEFARARKLNPLVRLILRLASASVRRQARQSRLRYTFLFMQASGAQLAQITSLIESGAIRPVVDRLFPFSETNAALAYVDTGRARGKVVVTLD